MLYDYIYGIPRLHKFIETESRIMVTHVWTEGGNGELLSNKYRGYVWNDEKLW